MKTQKMKTEAEQQTRAFFVYGTLMDPEVLSEVITDPLDPRYGRKPSRPEPEQTTAYLRDQRMHKATLFGYERHCVRWAGFPAIVACAGASVEGYLVEGVTDEEVRRLDRYEGEMYKSAPVRVAMGWGLDGESKDGEGGEWRSALAYVWVLGLDQLVDTKEKVWSPDLSYW